MPHWIVWSGVVAAVLFALWGIPMAAQHIPLWSGLLLIVGASLFSAGVISALEYQASRGKELSIALLWRTDFNVGSYKMLEDLSTDLYTTEAKRLGRFDFGVGFYGSFDAKSLFMSLYVPASDHAADLIGWFADGYQTYLDDARANFHI